MRLPILDYIGRNIIVSKGSNNFPTITLSAGWNDSRLCGTVFIRVGTTNPDVIILGDIRPFKAYAGQASTGFMYQYFPTVNTSLNDGNLGNYEYKMWVRMNFKNGIPQSYEINVCRRSNGGSTWDQIIEDSSIGDVYYNYWATLI